MNNLERGKNVKNEKVNSSKLTFYKTRSPLKR